MPYKSNVQRKAVHAKQKNPNYNVKIGDIVKTWGGVGRVSHIRHDYNTQLPTKVSVRVDQHKPRYYNIDGIKVYPRGKI